MDDCKDRDPELAIVVSAIKTRVKATWASSGERPRGEGRKPGYP